MEDVSHRGDYEKNDHDAQPCCNRGVYASRSLDAAQVEDGEEPGKEQHPQYVRNFGDEVNRGFTAPDGADQWIENVIHGHTPASHIAESGMQFFANVRERR